MSGADATGPDVHSPIIATVNGGYLDSRAVDELSAQAAPEYRMESPEA